MMITKESSVFSTAKEVGSTLKSKHKEESEKTTCLWKSCGLAFNVLVKVKFSVSFPGGGEFTKREIRGDHSPLETYVPSKWGIFDIMMVRR